MSTVAGVVKVEVAGFKNSFRYFSLYQRSEIIRTFKNYSKYYNAPLTIEIRPTITENEIEILQKISESGCPHCYLRIFGHDGDDRNCDMGVLES